MRHFAAAVVAVTIGLTGLAQAADQDATLINRTGATIESLTVSVAGTNSLQENVLDEDDTLANGDFATIAFDQETRGCLYDLKVVYDDGSASAWSKVNLCESSRIAIYWDRATGTTRAVAETE